MGEGLGVGNLSPGADESQVSHRKHGEEGRRTKLFHLSLCVRVTQRRRGPMDGRVCLED